MIRAPTSIVLTCALALGAHVICPHRAAAQTAELQRRLIGLTESALTPQSARQHLLAALTEASRSPAITHDTLSEAILAVVRRRTDSVPPEVTITRDSAGPIVLGYVDLSADGSYTGELRLRMTTQRSLVLGVTTRLCDESCRREVDVAVSWTPQRDSGWRLESFARQEANGDPILFRVNNALADAAAATVVSTVRGVVRDENGRPIAGIEVYSADGMATTQSDAKGEYRLTLSMPPGGVLLTTRRIGWAPTFRTILPSEGRAVAWNPVLHTTAVLAKQLVTATGLPEALWSFRFNDFIARRARGVGQFFMAEEIWSASSLGDVLNRANGVDVSFTVGNNIRLIRIPSCSPSLRVGVYIDGINETNANRSAEEVLTQFVSSAIVAMEFYRFRSEIPGEFARPEYCAVIALWTR